ncbi:sucrose nonfermenting 4-like protein isoform X1 [Zingiber officinale]|uniref:sucrose nonfermenting 4-like protein isoform X1 n=2 Tax=Zingiber officinale TaxID=94328 RepID=UPI001C4ADF97|nr:sucrose nonfermenting 4-like protein isoform X1 [Zingiber officinale]
MFPAGTERTQDAGGISGSLLIPWNFVWRYGGNRVFVIGSFTRWTERVEMVPLEGDPTVFQVMWSLSPGIHQYMFFVDGAWRHDEQQPHMMSTYGIVNTLILDQDANHVHTLLSSELPGNRMSMDVDHENFRIVVSNLRISEADIGISRDCISEFLSTHSAYELLPDSGKVIALEVSLPVKQAFHILYEQGIPVAPLLDTCSGEFVGVLSPLDFILILKELSNRGSNLTEEELETHTISAWKEAKQQLSSQMVLHGQSQRQLIHAGPYDSLKEVALKILQNRITTIPIVRSLLQEDSFPHLLHLASLSGILRCICRHFRHSTTSVPILQQAIFTIPLGTWVSRIGESNGNQLAKLKPNESLSRALTLLVEAEVSSIPIVDDNDRLLDTYSRSDIISLAKDKVYARIHLDETSIYQALQLRNNASPSHGSVTGQRFHTCLRSDSLLKVMEQLATPGVRRVIIVEAATNHVEGIISLSDVFRFLFSMP